MRILGPGLLPQALSVLRKSGTCQEEVGGFGEGPGATVGPGHD